MSDQSPTKQSPSSIILFTSREKKVGKVFYFVLVTGVLISSAGAALSIADWFGLDSQKWAIFLGLSVGAKIAIVGLVLFVFFLLMIIFTQLYNRGNNAFTRKLFTAKRRYKEMEKDARAMVMSAGIMIAILLFLVGLVYYVIEDVILPASQSQSGILLFIASLTSGQLVLFVGLLVVGFTLVMLAIAWLWNAGNIFFARKFFKPRAKGNDKW